MYAKTVINVNNSNKSSEIHGISTYEHDDQSQLPKYAICLESKTHVIQITSLYGQQWFCV